MTYQQYTQAQPRNLYRQQYGNTASNQAQSNAWDASNWGGGTQAGTSQYANSGQGQYRGGAQDYTSTGTAATDTRQAYNGSGATGNSDWTLGNWTGGWQGTTGLGNQGTQSTATTYNSGLPANYQQWNTQALRDQYSQYLNSMLAVQQTNQNASQYSQDFNEAQRRWNEQFGWTQQGDAFNMGLATRQQQTAEEQARIAAQQWSQQFGWTQQNDLFSQGLANRQLGFSYDQLAQQGDLQRQQMEIEKAYNEGRLSNDARTIALQELSQKADDVWRRDQLAQQLGFSRDELASRDALARYQTEQEMARLQATLAQQQQAALLQATGRNQMPNTKWMRRS